MKLLLKPVSTLEKERFHTKRGGFYRTEFLGVLSMLNWPPFREGLSQILGAGLASPKLGVWRRFRI